MENTRLLKLLRSLSAEELRSLKKFVNSPFFNQRREVVALLETLEKPLKSGRPAPEKEIAFSAVFGRDDFDDHRIRMAMSFLFQLTNQFLAVRDFLEDGPALRQRTAVQLRRRNLADQAAQARVDWATELLRQPVRDAGFQQQYAELLLEKYRDDTRNGPGTPLPPPEISEQLDRAFLSRKLWLAWRRQGRLSEARTELWPAVLRHFEATQPPDDPCTSVYFQACLVGAQPDEPVHFQTFKTQFFQHWKLFGAEEARELTAWALQFCQQRYRDGDAAYLPQQLDIYRQGLEHRWFLDEAGEIPRSVYLQATATGLAMNDPDWVGRFLHAYRAALPEPEREHLFHFCAARVEYHRHRPEEVLSLLENTSFDDPVLQLATRTLQLKAAVEAGQTKAAIAHCRSLLRVVNKNKALQSRRESYGQLGDFILKILETPAGDAGARAALRSAVEAADRVLEKAWLLGRLAGR